MASLSRFDGFSLGVRDIQAPKNYIQNGGFDIKGDTFKYWNVSGTPGFKYAAKRPGYQKSYAAASLTPPLATKTEGGTIVLTQTFNIPSFIIHIILLIIFLLIAHSASFAEPPPSNASFAILLNGKTVYETTDLPTKFTEEKMKLRPKKGDNELAFHFTNYDTDVINQLVLDNVFIGKA